MKTSLDNTQTSDRPIESVWTIVEEAIVPLVEQAFLNNCKTVGIFEENDEQKYWRVEGVRHKEQMTDGSLESALELLSLITESTIILNQEPIAETGWLEKTSKDFPPQLAGKRFLIEGTHLEERNPILGRISLLLDAGIAFGSGEHHTTRGCLTALEELSHLKPRKILDMGCGSGILGIAAAIMLKTPIQSIDIDPKAVRVTKDNARLNKVGPLIHAFTGHGATANFPNKKESFDLIFANILARPLCQMAPRLARILEPKGHIVLSGLLKSQERMVSTAYRLQGLVLKKKIPDGHWTTLIFAKPVRHKAPKARKLIFR